MTSSNKGSLWLDFDGFSILVLTEYETLQVGQDIVEHVTFDQTMKEKN